ncbi:MAG: DegV family protein [Lachnospiraceae bacterium]|nr:DegV family protein [Robinsoniella sp.]MDY3766520.1 DegV family protein [Lachnospiraceae bacterium]
MSFKVVVDSCGELTREMKESGNFVTASLTMQVDEEIFVDDETFDQKKFLEKIAQSPNCPKSSCPSPDVYREAFDVDVDHIYAVTLSAELSGSYNSAQLGKNLILEEKPEKKIYVFNSRSASIGETLIAMKIQECEEKGMEFEAVVEQVENYIAEQNTFFVLENLETLRKNGRLSNLKAFVANALKIKPVMASTPEGTIIQLDQARGINKALVKMVNYIVEKTEHPEEKILAISHCNCPDRAQMVKEALQEKMNLKEIFVLDTAGISSMYANDGGIIIAV